MLYSLYTLINYMFLLYIIVERLLNKSLYYVLVCNKIDTINIKSILKIIIIQFYLQQQKKI